MSVTTSTSSSPRDPYNLVLFLFYYMAIGTLLPWNFFINVNGYWMHKFRTVNSTVATDKKNDLQLEFTSDMAVAAMVPNVLFLILNGLFGHRFKTTPRLLWSLCLVVILFTSALVLVRVNSDTWQHEFLVITLVTVVLINIFTALFQGGLFGLAGCFPSKYMNAVLGGQGIGGIFAATINILLLAVGGDDVSAAFYCFLLSIIFLAGSVLAFFFVTKTKFYQHHVQDCSPSPSSTTLSESSPLMGQSSTKTISVSEVLKSIWVEGLTVFTIYIITLGCFPALTVLIESTNKDKPNSSAWENQFFVPVSCFLFYNIGDYIGRLIAASPVIPNPGSKLALIMSCARVVFIPLFLLCNLAPNERHITEVYFYSDGVYIGLIFFLSISNGFLTSIVMVNAPAQVEAHQQQTASNMMVGLLGMGLVVGAATSAGMVKLL